MKSRLWRRIKWYWINCYIRFMLRTFGDEIYKIGRRMIGGQMCKSPISQTYFVEAISEQANIDRLTELAGNRLEQFDWIIALQWQVIAELKGLCRELPVNYKKRFPVADKFLNQLNDKIIVVNDQAELLRKIADAIDSFCGGDIEAVGEINGS